MAKKPRKAVKTKSKKSKPAKSKAVKRKAAPKKKPARKSAPAARNVGGVNVPKDLEARLMALALEMEKNMDAVILQALSEFADAWEDHFRTLLSLAEDDRMQLVVKPE